MKPGQVQHQELRQQRVVGERRRPAVGGEDGGVEFLVGQVEPGGALGLAVGHWAFASRRTVTTSYDCQGFFAAANNAKHAAVES